MAPLVNYQDLPIIGAQALLALVRWLLERGSSERDERERDLPHQLCGADADSVSDPSRDRIEPPVERDPRGAARPGDQGARQNAPAKRQRSNGQTRDRAQRRGRRRR